MEDEEHGKVKTKETIQAEIDKKNAEIEARRKEISVRRGGEFVGYNDPELQDLIPHETAEAQGASGTEDGFLFGGKIYPSAEAASDVNLPKAGISLPKKESKPIKTILINKPTKVQ